jgi:hypothetical protein
MGFGESSCLNRLQQKPVRTKIRLQLKVPAIILVILVLLLLAVQSAYAGEAYQKEIVTGMDENGNLTKTEEE